MFLFKNSEYKLFKWRDFNFFLISFFFCLFLIQCLGNHEFAYGLNGLLPFLNGIKFPMVISNLNVIHNHALWRTPSLKRSVVLNVNGTRVGFVGYLTPDTEQMANSLDIRLTPEIDAVKYVNNKTKNKTI